VFGEPFNPIYLKVEQTFTRRKGEYVIKIEHKGRMKQRENKIKDIKA
jgi:hypothetical protein